MTLNGHFAIITARSQANDQITTKLAHDGAQVSLHPGCAQGQGQGQRSRDTGTFVLSQKSLLLAGTKLAHDAIRVLAGFWRNGSW